MILQAVELGVVAPAHTDLYGHSAVAAVAEILVNGADPATTPVKTFDNGTATVNTETCAAIGLNYDDVATTFAPLCTQVNEITTAESFDE